MSSSNNNNDTNSTRQPPLDNTANSKYLVSTSESSNYAPYSSGPRETSVLEDYGASATVIAANILNKNKETTSSNRENNMNSSTTASVSSIMSHETGNAITRDYDHESNSKDMKESSSLETISNSRSPSATAEIPRGDVDKEDLSFSNAAASIHIDTWLGMILFLFSIMCLF